MADIVYKRLTRARAGFSVAVLARTSLWLGPDHLLRIESNGYSESYKRFYFRDIQGFIVQRTTRARSVSIFLGAVTFLLLFLTVITRDPDGRTALLIAMAVFGLILLFYVLPGPSCRCQIRTAVQTEELSSLARLNQTRKVLLRLQPLIAEAQGGLISPEAIPDLLRQMNVSEAPVQNVSAVEPAGDLPKIEPDMPG